ATSPSSGSCSSTRSRSTKGYWLGMRRTRDAMSMALMKKKARARGPLAPRAPRRWSASGHGLGGGGGGLAGGGGAGVGGGGRPLGRLPRVVGLHDHVPRDVEVAVDGERDLGVQDDVDLLVLGHGLDVGLDLDLELVVQGLGLALGALAHPLQLGLAVLE